MTAYPLDPELDCDLIMKGGITSGVIYPGVVCRLARVYRLRSVGGASAGAIAAAAAAAAELGRAGGGFDRLAQLPERLTAPAPAGGSLLFRLFQPQRGTAGLFRVATAGLGRRGAGRAVRMVLAAVLGFPLWFLAGALLGLVVVAAGLAGNGVARWVSVTVGLVVLAVGGLAGTVAGVVRRLGTSVPANGLGLCSGMPGHRRPTAAALVPWLHGTLQDLAGRAPGEPPLTFGDLAAAGVELRMMTTNLTRRQPLATPWLGREYFFDPARWRTLFPADVVDWLERHPPEPRGAAGRRFETELLRRQALPLRPLPAAPELPVVVATRLSLSFPLLISAVPLHAVDYHASAPSRDARSAVAHWRAEHPEGTVEEALTALPRREFRVNWFSDGGICSNLPVHFFDRPLPARPTFAVDLTGFPPGQRRSADEAANSYFPDANQAGVHRRWTTWAPGGMLMLVDFGRSIVDTARAWVDESQLVMPGYRDRIVTIFHDRAEGGLNLSMPGPVVSSLTARGDAAAAKLADRFAGPEPGKEPAAGWDNHRWIRFRTAACGLEEWLTAFRDGYLHEGGAAPAYRRLAGPEADADLPSYRLSEGRREVVDRRTGDLLALAAEWETEPAGAFTDGAPLPRPMLRLVPYDDPTPGPPRPQSPLR